MRIGRALTSSCGLTLVSLALSPVPTRALGPPSISSITPDEGGSAGGTAVKITGTNFERALFVVFDSAKPIECKSGMVPPNTHCRILSGSELGVDTPAHERGTVPVTVCSKVTETSTACSPETEAARFTYLPEVYKNEAAVGAARIPSIGYGQLLLNSPQTQTFAECVSLGFGAGWNEGTPTTAHGEILSWWASGHAPTAEHSELGSRRCRFDYHGSEQFPYVGPTWVSAEPKLKLVIQEGIVCLEPTKKLLTECPNESEREPHETIVREVSREPPSLPWNIQFTEKSEKMRVRVGLPEECKAATGAERTELSKCPEASEREPGKSPSGCNIPPSPDPAGCVRVQMLTDPPLNVHLEYEGYLEPLAVNGVGNGLSPSSWEFEGNKKGEPSLHLRETPTTEGTVTGSVKILGYSGQELIGVK